jgi:hypothetical protein
VKLSQGGHCALTRPAPFAVNLDHTKAFIRCFLFEILFTTDKNYNVFPLLVKLGCHDYEDYEAIRKEEELEEIRREPNNPEKRILQEQTSPVFTGQAAWNDLVVVMVGVVEEEEEEEERRCGPCGPCGGFSAECYSFD